MTAPTQEVLYRLDADNRIESVGGAWDDFAHANKGEAVRAGRSVQYTLRCDGPGERRWLRMRAEPVEHGGVLFRSRLAEAQPRESVPLLDPAQPRGDAKLRVRCQCNRVAVGDDWREAEDAVEFVLREDLRSANSDQYILAPGTQTLHLPVGRYVMELLGPGSEGERHAFEVRAGEERRIVLPPEE